MAEADGERENGRGNPIESAFESGHRRRAELAGGEGIARVPVIGLTGGIASGKTTVANFFKKWGAVVISGDELGWRVLQNKSVQKKLVGLFGSEILSKSQINRKVLGPRVFANKRTLSRFNRIVHPPLLALLKREVAHARKKKCRAIVIDAALLAEWRIPVKLDFLLMVHAPKKVQLKRFLSKGFSRAEVRRRIASQMLYRRRRRLADMVLINGGNLSGLQKKSGVIWKKIIGV